MLGNAFASLLDVQRAARVTARPPTGALAIQQVLVPIQQVLVPIFCIFRLFTKVLLVNRCILRSGEVIGGHPVGLET